MVWLNKVPMLAPFQRKSGSRHVFLLLLQIINLIENMCCELGNFSTKYAKGHFYFSIAEVATELSKNLFPPHSEASSCKPLFVSLRVPAALT